MSAVEFEFHLPLRLRKRRKWYLAVCPALDIASQGKTKQKAKDNLKDAVRGFLADCFDRGTLEEVLKQSGFTAARPNVVRKRRRKQTDTISVPVALLTRVRHTDKSAQEA